MQTLLSDPDSIFHFTFAHSFLIELGLDIFSTKYFLPPLQHDFRIFLGLPSFRFASIVAESHLVKSDSFLQPVPQLTLFLAPQLLICCYSVGAGVPQISNTIGRRSTRPPEPQQK